MSDSSDPTRVVPKGKKKKKTQNQERTEHIPLYNIILWDDNDHTYEYVIEMLQALFGFPPEKGFQMADTVSKANRVILLTTTREYAEFKQQQIHDYGPDRHIPESAGSMTATIEPQQP